MRKVVSRILIACSVCGLSALLANAQAPTVTAESRGTLEIVVFDETGKPFPGAQVSLPGHRASTGTNGSCKFDLQAGRYPVLINKSGYRGRRITVGIRPGETTTEKVQLQKLSPARAPRK